MLSEIIRDADKDWNKEFQTYLEMPGTVLRASLGPALMSAKDAEERHRKIFQLAHDLYVKNLRRLTVS